MSTPLVQRESARAILEPTAQSIMSLSRVRVNTRLERAVQFPIVVVCAPAGFGKSTVLREFFEARQDPYRSVNLTAKHADLLGFMRVLATCVGDIAPALLTSFIGVHDRTSRSDDAPRQIAAWAAEHLRSLDLILMIDGLEHVTDDRLFMLLSELVDLTSETRIRWIVVSVSAAKLPIVRWLANNRMDLAIDDIDLALTENDLAPSVAVVGAQVSSEVLHALVASARNFPAALALALSDLPSLADGAERYSSPRSYDQFAECALAARPAHEQRFMLETCLWKSFDADLLAFAGWDGVDAMLGRLCAGAAFLYREAGGPHRYHEIFRCFLENRLRSSEDDSYARIATATAAGYRAVGRWSDALEMYTELHASSPLAQLLSERGFELIDRGEADVVFNALGALGDNEYAEFPVALAVKASLESLNGSFDVAEAWFRHALEMVGDSSERSAIVFRFATDLVRRDRRDAIELLEPIVERGGHDLALAVSLAGLLATAYATHHMNAEAAVTIARALERIADVDDSSVRAKVYFQAGYVALFARDPLRAKSYAQRALDTALGAHLYDIAARSLSILYNVAMDYDDDITATRFYLEALVSCSLKAGSRYLLMYATLGLYEIEVLCGNLLESKRLDEKLQTFELDFSIVATETLLPAEALRATWSGDFDRAYRLVAGTAEKQITPVRRAQRYAEIAVYAAAAGLRSEALVAASRAVTTIPKLERSHKAVAFAKIYVALALTLLGRRARARQILLTLSRSSHVTPRLEDVVHAIQAINERWTRGRYSADLRTVLDRLDASAFGGIARLIEALPLPQAFRGQFKHLTPTERNVLGHMSAGLNTAEVASLSGYSHEAIDAHVVSLCRKLGCSSARSAVALATSANARRTVPVNVD